VDATPATSTRESATGLGFIGKVRPLESPHTESNYLLREMAFRVARVHAAKLRSIALLLGFALPALFFCLAIILGGGLAIALGVLAAASALAGLLVERWLIFAEATHTVALYYPTPR
jgi:DMSO reductase anchor subunit